MTRTTVKENEWEGKRKSSRERNTTKVYSTGYSTKKEILGRNRDIRLQE